MLLCVDIGNSSIKFGVFDREKLTTRFSISTKRDYTPGDISGQIGDKLNDPVDAAVVCSVVPVLDASLAEFIRNELNVEPKFVRSTDEFGLIIGFPIESFGTDRLVNSAAAAEKYGVPCVVVSFGTATTIDVVSAEREYIGGLIAPGMPVMAKALELSTAKLPVVSPKKPEHVISKTTESAIRSGIVYGQIAMVDGLLQRVLSELNYQPKVIATGGFADLMAEEIDLIDTVDSELTLYGLRIVYDRASRSQS